MVMNDDGLQHQLHHAYSQMCLTAEELLRVYLE